ncbi:hypothetical protein VE01_04510 [Pseudogymnoascus verrucosus]|uniref:C2H2-type domain-containing protein n=1 Tax=Pseudogymnoascus verrucosus TaxID=342668 RepID=A0A1B8GP16_9PEZI|nr:uncharacterized protein VE01_04510 [Pseudogymnoascus verrucosus]OBT97589.1 hypothetical protein VE01_04510 [Pseudogymnoascus verrucosus]
MNESAQDIEQRLPDENETPNGTFNGSPGPQLEKRNRPYVCNHKPCNRKNFSNKSGLERHKREVHSSQNFTCPIRSCDRSKKGFHRRHNLGEHQKRVHGIRSSNSPRALSINSEELSESEESTPSPPYEIEAEGASQDIKITDVMPTCREDLKIKLRGLRAMREKIDRDIKSMERVLRIMGGER